MTGDDMHGILFGLFATLLLATSASAEFAKVNHQSEFVSLISGKTLSRPFVKLQVSPDGWISGRVVRWDLTCTWTWENGYFCRDLYWGGDALGYNCQEVKATPNGRIRFTSDKGKGDSAAFRLN